MKLLDRLFSRLMGWDKERERERKIIEDLKQKVTALHSSIAHLEERLEGAGVKEELLLKEKETLESILYDSNQG